LPKYNAYFRIVHKSVLKGVPPQDFNFSGSFVQNAGHKLNQRRLPRAIIAYKPYEVPLLDFQRNSL
jgi:hypothetical protein